MTIYLCINCRKTWEIENGDADYTPRGSLCKPCLKERLVLKFKGSQQFKK
jgi:DNA-directed RNA polymerase subunit RPC12/RpoP